MISLVTGNNCQSLVLTLTLHCLVKRALELKDWQLQILESRLSRLS